MKTQYFTLQEGTQILAADGAVGDVAGSGVSRVGGSDGANVASGVVASGGHGGARCPSARLRVEKIEGGLLVAGVVVAANCQLALPAFGSLFILVGCVLTAASYRGPSSDEDPKNYADRVAFTGNSRVLGPTCLGVGLLMLAAGAGLCLLARRARRRQQERLAFHCPLHGDFYPLSTTTQTASCSSAPRCPMSVLSSSRSSSLSAAGPPSPLLFVVAPAGSARSLCACRGSIGAQGLVGAAAALASPDQPFGSIRSLSAGREVASFPMSRSPTPTASPSPTPPATVRTFRQTPPLSPSPPTPPADVIVDAEPDPPPPERGARKSVSIVLPDDTELNRP